MATIKTQALMTVWSFWAHMSGLLMIAAILTIMLIGLTTKGVGSVVWKSSDFKLMTPTVKVGGDVSYSMSLRADESCPGIVQHTYVELKVVPSVTVTTARPLARPGITVKHQLFIQPLPAAVYPGFWRVTVSVLSYCPTRMHTDTVAIFDVAVE